MGPDGIVPHSEVWNQEVEVERIRKRLGIRQPLVEMFSNDPRLGRLAEWDPAAEGAIA